MKTKRCILTVFLLVFSVLFSACEPVPPPEAGGEGSETGKDAETADALCTHTFGAWEILRDPVCDALGKRTRACTACGVRMSERFTDESAHTPVPVPPLAPTCEREGHGGGTACANCGVLLSTTLPEARLPHDFLDGKCRACGARTPSDGLSFVRNAVGYTVTGIGSCRDACVVIPDMYAGLPVTEIATDAFSRLPYAPRALYIPDSVTRVCQLAVECRQFLTVYTGKNAYFESGALFFHGSGEVVNQTGAPLGTNAVLGNVSDVLVHSLGASRCTVTADGFVFLSLSGRSLLCDYVGEDADVVLPAYFQGGKYYVAPYALYGETGVRSLTVGEGVLGIGSYAFAASTWETLDLRGVYDTLPFGAFMECYRLCDVTIPSNVRTVGGQCFFGVRLGTVTVGASVEEIGQDFALSVAVAVYRNPSTPKIPLQ